MAWVAQVLMFVAAYLCFYTNAQERAYLAEKKKKNLQSQLIKDAKLDTQL